MSAIVKTKELYIGIGNRLQELRLLHGMTRQQIGKKLGVSHQQIQKYEAAKDAIPVSRLQEACWLFGRPMEYFCGSIPADGDIRGRSSLELMKRFNQLPDKQQDAIRRLVSVMLREEE